MNAMWIRTVVRCVIALTVILWVSSAISADWVPLNGASRPEEVRVSILSQGNNEIIIDVTISGIWVDEVSTTGGDFLKIQVPDGGVAGVVSQPEYPAIRKLIAIPEGGSVSWEVIERTEQVISLPDLAQKPLYPRQPPVEKRPGALQNAQFAWDQDYYSRDRWLPVPEVEVGERSYLRAYSFVPVTVYPVQMNPQRTEIRVVSHVSLRLQIENADLLETQSRILRYGTLQNRMMAGELLEVPPSLASLDELPTPPVGFLIICDPLYENSTDLEDYIEWKEKKGYHVTLATTAETGTQRIDIENYIENAYDNWDIPPAYVLLIGDTDDIPHYVGTTQNNPATDLYYACVEGGDYFPDIGLGRLSVMTPIQLGNIISKILNFECVEWTGNNDWETHASFLASNDNWQITEGTHNYVISAYLDPAGYTIDRFYTHTYNATTQQVIDAINQGRSLIIYSGHGSPYEWADGPPMDQNDVRNLTNSVFPFVCSFSCQTGQFEYNECFGETWIREDHAAVTFWGSSVTSYWDEDDILEKELFEGFFDNQNPGDDVEFTWVSGMTNYGKIGLYQHYGSTQTVRRYFEMYNILGDPTVDLWTSVPQLVTVDHPSVVFVGANSVTVEVTDGGVPVENAMVCVMDDEICGTAYTNASGEAEILFDQPPSAPMELAIHVTGHNIHPYEGTLQVIIPSGPFVAYQSHTINDSTGNNNGLLDYNESVTLDMTLRNHGTQTATNVNVTLGCDSDLITITDSIAAFGDIGVEQEVTVEDAFEFELSPEVPDYTGIEFTVIAVSNEGSWESDFEIVAHAPDIVCTEVTVDDAAGNNDGILDPGETADLEITITNQGSSASAAMTAELTTLEALVTIGSGTGTFSALDPDQEASETFTVTASSACPLGYPAGLILSVNEAATGRSQVDRFEVEVGDATQLPTGPDNYGYMAYDSEEITGAPQYNWVEINSNLGGPGTFSNIINDDQTRVFELPFTFQYYGSDFNYIYVCSNGWVCLGYTTSTSYFNTPIPNPGGPPAMMALQWQDLNPENGGSIWVWADTVGGRFVVEYYQIHRYSPSYQWDTFEIILYDPAVYPTSTGDGQILFQYQTANDFSSCTIGIESSDQAIGIQYLYDGEYDRYGMEIVPETAILFTTVDTLSSGTVIGTASLLGGSGSIQDVTVRIGTATTNPLANGTYTLIDVPSGLQVLMASLYGYGTITMANLVVPSSGTLSGIDINLPYLEPPADLTGMAENNYLLLQWDPTVFQSAGEPQLVEVSRTLSSVASENQLHRNNRTPGNNGIDESLEFLGYVIYRDGVAIDSLVQNNEYQDIPPQNGTYEYYVTAGFTLGESDTTNHVSVLYEASNIPESGNNLLPERFALHQNYPNPFNPETTIPFDLPQAGRVTVQIYNVLGQQVTIVIDQPLPAGFHSVTWDGSGISSGVYFYRIMVMQNHAVIFEDLKKAVMLR